MKLETFFQEHPKAALGFSGGVDSSYLLYAGLQNGADIRPYFVKTVFQPQFELEDAKRLTEALGVALTVLELPVLETEKVRENGPRRCYYCKQQIFGALQKRALADGYTVLLDGSNASDDAGDRPGMQALAELSVLSPLRLSGLTKTQIRALSKEAGLFTWEKPAYACLATRVPTGRSITQEDLARVEAAEGALFALGFSDFRVRLNEEGAKLQLPVAQWPNLLERREAVRAALAPFFSIVTLDLAGR